MALIKKGKKEPKNDGSLVNSSLTIRLQVIESIDQAFFHVPVDFCSSLTLSDGVRSAPYVVLIHLIDREQRRSRMLFSTRSRWRGGEKLLVKWATQSD